jgi:hypothetical protein
MQYFELFFLRGDKIIHCYEFKLLHFNTSLLAINCGLQFKSCSFESHNFISI